MAGSIQERGPDTWRVRVSAGFDSVTHKRRWVTRTVKGSRSDAEEVRARLVVETSDGKWIGTTTTLSDLFVAWLPKAKLAPETRYDYGLVIKTHINPHIGSMPVNKIRAHHLDALYHQLEQDGMKPARLRRVHNVIRSALKRAVKWQWIAANPAIDASPTAVPKPDIEPPTPTQVRLLFEKADSHSQFAGTFFRLAANLGSRRGELCGLQWRDIDLEGRTVAIRRTVGVVSGATYAKELKTATGKPRTPIPVDADTVELLRRWRIATAEQRLALADPDDWVFPAPKGAFQRPDVVSHLFAKLRDAADIDKQIHLHSLRHYVATQLLHVAGVDAGTVSQRVGHSRTSTTTDFYGHPVNEQARDAAEVIARITRGG